MSRVTTVPYMAQQILRIDFTGCRPGAFLPIIDEAMGAITASAPNSVLALTVFKDVRFDPGTVVEMERFARETQPFLKRNALVGISGLKKVVFQSIKPLYRKPVELFDEAEPAMRWLAVK